MENQNWIKNYSWYFKLNIVVVFFLISIVLKQLQMSWSSFVFTYSNFLHLSSPLLTSSSTYYIKNIRSNPTTLSRTLIASTLLVPLKYLLWLPAYIKSKVLDFSYIRSLLLLLPLWPKSVFTSLTLLILLVHFPSIMFLCLEYSLLIHPTHWPCLQKMLMVQ